MSSCVQSTSQKSRRLRQSLIDMVVVWLCHGIVLGRYLMTLSNRHALPVIILRSWRSNSHFPHKLRLS